MPNPNQPQDNSPSLLAARFEERHNPAPSNLIEDMANWSFQLTDPNESASNVSLNGSTSIFEIEYNAFTGKLVIQLSKYLKDLTINHAEGNAIRNMMNNILLQLQNARSEGQDFTKLPIESVLFGIKNWIRHVRQISMQVDAILVKLERIVNEGRDNDF